MDVLLVLRQTSGRRMSARRACVHNCIRACAWSGRHTRESYEGVGRRTIIGKIQSAQYGCWISGRSVLRFIYYFPGRWVPLELELLTLDAHMMLAIAAQRSGFDGLAVDEHPIPSEAWRQGPGGHDALDPFITLAAVASSAPRLKLVTYAAVVPYRNPFLLAKQAATLDLLSGGRLVLGVGTGYLPGEFEALGVDFDERNALFDEGLEVMKLAWRGEPVDYEGRHFTAKAVTAQPRPHSRPHPPLWIGGNSKLTMRRVVDRAQGWMPMPNPRRAPGPGRSDRSSRSTICSSSGVTSTATPRRGAGPSRSISCAACAMHRPTLTRWSINWADSRGRASPG